MKAADRLQIFVDLDGVLANFLQQICLQFNRDLDQLPVGEYRLERLLGMPWTEIDATIGRNHQFWASIPEYPWTRKVLPVLREYGDVFILSSPWQQSAECHKAKLEWCDRVLGVAMSDVILTPHKHLLSAPGRVLIDDCAENCQRWSNRGGHAVVFPCHHNRNTLVGLHPDPFIHFLLAIDLIVTDIHLRTKSSLHGQRN